MKRSSNPLLNLGPGLLIAATGVGAGDLATAAFTGARLGTTILWVVLLGAFFKFVLNEGLTRWQLATGTTILEGAFGRLGVPVRIIFLLYFGIWSFMVAAALMSACGAAGQAMLPFFDHPPTGKIVYGITQSLIGLILVRMGGYRLFERVMGICVALMFITVIATAIILSPDWIQVVKGMIVPTIPDSGGEGLPWIIALLGGIGGTITILCYGYWIREEGRYGTAELKACRWDLAAGYTVTAIFGLAMVIVGSSIVVEGKGSTLIIQLSEKLAEESGHVLQWTFLVGAWAAMFSSLLGVWQSVPYLFADMIDLMSRRDRPLINRIIDTDGRAYLGYLYGIAILPIVGLWVGFARMQKLYAITGALFIPVLAVILLLLNNSTSRLDPEFRNSGSTNAVLLIVLVFFLFAGWLTVQRILAG